MSTATVCECRRLALVDNMTRIEAVVVDLKLPMWQRPLRTVIFSPFRDSTRRTVTLDLNRAETMQMDFADAYQLYQDLAPYDDATSLSFVLYVRQLETLDELPADEFDVEPWRRRYVGLE